jgi:putative peptidoglycan lipid II flippase
LLLWPPEDFANTINFLQQSPMLYLAFGVDRALASLMSNSSIASGFVSNATGFFMAFQLMLLPISIFAMAVSTAAFPTLATLYASGNFERLRHVILTTLRGILLLSIPASLGLIGLARPIIRLLYQHGNFTAQDTSVVYDPLIFLAIGIAGHASVEILTRSFYALRDSRTPVYVSLCQFAFMIGLSILFFPLGLRGLGLAMSIGVLGEAAALLLLLRQRLRGFDLRALFIFTVSVLAASLVSTLAALVGYAVVDRIAASTSRVRSKSTRCWRRAFWLASSPPALSTSSSPASCKSTTPCPSSTASPAASPLGASAPPDARARGLYYA